MSKVKKNLEMEGTIKKNNCKSSTVAMFSVFRYAKQLLLINLILINFALLGFVAEVGAQTLKDWEDALVQAKTSIRNTGFPGTESIPYYSLRSRAADTQAKVKSSSDFSCSNPQWKTKALRNTIKQIEVQVNRSDIDPAEKSTKEQVLKQKKNELAETIANIDVRLGRAKEHMRYRKEVANVFKSVIYQAQRETDPEITKVANVLIPLWKKSINDHEDAIDDTNVAIRTCEECKRGYR